jgi:sugar lactone lactonase YvrE
MQLQKRGTHLKRQVMATLLVSMSLVVAACGASTASTASVGAPTLTPSGTSALASPSASGSVASEAAASASPSPFHTAQYAEAMTPDAPLKLLWQAGDPTQGEVRLGTPTIDPQGRVWVASSLQSRFWIFSPEGRLLEKWGTPGKGPGQFDFLDPSSAATDGAGGIAFGPDGSFWVVDIGNVRVDKFDASRHFVSSWGGFGTADGQFAKPVSIGIDEQGHVFIADVARSDIQEFDANGSYIRTFAKGATGPFLAVLPNGWVFTDLLPDGTPGHTQYQPGGQRGGTIDLSKLVDFPTGIAVDADGHVYLAGETSSEPSQPEGLMLLGGDGVEHFWPTGAEGIAVDPRGTVIYMTDPEWPDLRKYALPKP